MIQNSNKFLFSMLAYLLGNGLAAVCYEINFNFLYISIFFFFLILILTFLKREKIFFAFYLLFNLAAFFFSNSFALNSASDENISFYNDQDIHIEGYICNEPMIYDDKIKFEFCSENIFENNLKKEVKGRILIKSPRYPEYEYGDYLSIKGQILTPKNFDTFDYEKYLSLMDIYSVSYDPQIKIIEAKKSSFFYKKIFLFKNYVKSKIERILSEPYASFEEGILIGAKASIPTDILENFKISGLSHIIAISGYNITLIIVFISNIFSFLDKRKQIFISIFLIAVFVIFVGASSAVVRAGIMGSISIFAILFSRKSDVFITLIFSAFIMTIFNPKILFYDIGFQLSFLATFGLIYFSPIIGEYFKFPNFLNIRESLVMTLSAQITTLPIILYNFGNLSLIAPIANLLITPFVPIAMLFGFIAFLFSIFSLTLGKIIAVPAYLSLKIMIILTEFCARIPYASVNIKFFNWMFLLSYFGLLAWILWKRNSKEGDPSPECFRDRDDK